MLSSMFKPSVNPTGVMENPDIRNWLFPWDSQPLFTGSPEQQMRLATEINSSHNNTAVIQQLYQKKENNRQK